MSNKPIANAKNGGVGIAMWEGYNGNYSFTIDKRYKDKKTEEWKESKVFFKEDLIKLKGCIDEILALEGRTGQVDNSPLPTMADIVKTANSIPVFEDDDIPF